MLGLFTNRSGSVLGIDISSTAVKVLELSSSGGRYKVEAFAREPLPTGTVVENNIQDLQVVGEIIGKAVSRSRSGVKAAAVAVSGAAVITKNIEMDASLSDGEMETQIAVEADQYIPYALDEVAIDFEVQGVNEKRPERVNVLLAACRRDNVEALEEAVSIGGLKTKIVDVEAFVTERTYELIENQLELVDEDPVVAIIDIGATNTSLNILSRGQSIYTRDQLFGGKQLTDEIQRRYDMSPEEAEKAKCKGGLPDDYETDVLEPFRESVVQQISRSLQFFYSSSQFSDVDVIALAGGTAMIPGLVEKIQEKVGITARQVNPCADMALAGKVNEKDLAGDASGLLIACGLAMRSFD